MADLRVGPDSLARQLMEQVDKLTTLPGMGSLVAADLVFGLLEREFDTATINTAVAKALRPEPAVDLSAHRAILDIARGIDGRVRLVTTNFDLLFEACDGSLTKSSPPHLPDPTRFDDLAGIVHLHGHVNDTYSGAAGEGFILSSADFGRAYLSEAWATQFFRAILGKYSVLFVGYAADDPPVQYLLEALNRSVAASGNVFAFQVGSKASADALWRNRGVVAIAYDESDGYKNLWDSLN